MFAYLHYGLCVNGVCVCVCVSQRDIHAVKAEHYSPKLQIIGKGAVELRGHRTGSSVRCMKFMHMLRFAR